MKMSRSRALVQKIRSRFFEQDEELSDKEEAHRAQCYLIEYAHFFGFLPYRFDLRHSWVNDVEAKWDILRWKVTITIAVLLKTALLVQVGLDFQNGELDLMSANGMLKTFFTILLAFSSLLHVMTSIKRSDIPRLINSNHLYSDMYKENYDRNKGKMYQLQILNRVMKVFFFTLVAWTFSTVPVYLARCEFHLLSSIIPMCTQVGGKDGEKYQTIHGDTGLGLRMVYSLLQFLVATDMIGACFIYIAFAMPCIFVGLDIMKELTSMEETEKTNALLRTNHHWFLNYRCCQLLTINVNACLSTLMPIVISGFVTLIVASNYVILNMVSNIDIFTVCAVVNIFLLGFLFVTLDEGAKFCELSKTALTRRKTIISGEYWSRYINGFAPISVEIGSFQGLDKSSWPTVVSAIIDYTISLVLAF